MLSLIIVVLYLTAASLGNLEGDVWRRTRGEAIGKTLVYLAPALVCIWFPDMGGKVSPMMQGEMPPKVVLTVGWVLLLLPLVLSLLSVTGVLQKFW